jgi:outer membrane protein OmpA-like peptidoglycan-associated protein/uncharacterized Zn-binding protein involved in type VI secretion
MGKPGVRLTDMTAHGGTIIGPGVPTVMTGKMPAATILDQHVCPMVTGVVPHVGGPATLASTGVFIGKKPAGRVGDLHVCVGPPSMPVMGCFTVLIGEVGGGGGGGAGAAAAAASANISSPASVSPFPAAKPPESTELHYCQFKFVDSAGKGLGGIPYVFTGPDKAERPGCSAPEGDILYSGLAKGGSFKVKAGAVTDAKWPKAKAALDDELELTAKADGLADGTPAILTVLERSSTGQQRFLHKAECKVEGKKIKAKWKVDLGSDDTPSPKDDPQRTEYTYQFIAYAAGGVAVSDKLLIESDLEIEVLDEIAQPIADKPVEVLLKNGEVKTGKLDANGKFKVGKVPAKPASVRLAVPGIFRGKISGGVFDPGKCFVISSSTNFLPFQEIVKFSIEHPDLHLLIVGHTDRVGSEKNNLDLSKARAEALAAFLKDDVKAWEAWYDKAKPDRVRWGVLEDKHMLKALQDGGVSFLAGHANNKADRSYIAAVQHFQVWSNGRGTKLSTTGKIDGATRKELIKNYMASDGMALPGSINITTHGCGEFHNIRKTSDGVPDFSNRRVEIYFFEGGIIPPPVANCPPGGCMEWNKWFTGTTNLLKLTPSASGGIQRDEFSQSILDCFSELDKNKDGVVSSSDILEAFGNKDFKGEHGAMVATLQTLAIDNEKRTFRIFCNLNDDEPLTDDSGFTLLDIDLYDKLRNSNPGVGLVRKINFWYSTAKATLAKTDRAPFIGPVSPFDMSQGIVGDCWFLVAIVGLAVSRPNEITKMIKSIGNGKYEVSFPGVPTPITIEAPTDAELAAFSNTPGNGIWPVLLEKAYGTYNRTINRKKVSALDAADGGDRPIRGIKILTNHEVDEDELWATRNSTLRSKLRDAFAAGKVVTAEIIPQKGESNSKDGLPSLHAYTVLAFDPRLDTIKIRNPWGNITFKGANGPKGIIDVALGDFDTNFTDIFFEE